MFYMTCLTYMLKLSMMYHESLFTTGEEVIQFICDILIYATSLHSKICSEEKKSDLQRYRMYKK